MARYIKASKEEVGLSPYEIYFRGSKKIENVRLRIINYNINTIEELELTKVSEAIKYDDPQFTTWFNVDGIHDSDVLMEIMDGFQLDHLIASSINDVYSRPKVQEYDNCLLFSLKMMSFDKEENKITSENIVIIAKKDILITFQEKVGDVFDPLRERIRKGKTKIRKSGVEYLSFAILDIIFDNYKYIISEIGDKIESIEENLIKDIKVSTIEEINNYKKEILYLSKSIKPCREMVLEMVKMDTDLLSKKMKVHIEELHSNINQSLESLENYREILNDQLNYYHTTMSSKLNDIMKFLTVFSVIFIPMTFIAGVYGTNFDYLPELHYKYSYFLMWGVMICMALGMITYFKKKDWF